MAPSEEAAPSELAPPPEPGAPSDYAPGGRSYRRLMVALPAAGLATFAPLYSPHGLLPVLGRDYGVDEPTAALAISAGTIGITAGALAWALAGDRIGRPKALRAGVIAAAVLGWVVLAMPSFPLILAVRFVQGLCLAAVPSLAMAYLAEQVDRRYTVLAAGAFISGNTIGGLSGRILAAPLGAWLGWRWGVGSVALLASVATLVFCLTLPAPVNRMPSDGTFRQTLHLVGLHLRSRAMMTIFAQGFLMFGGFIALYNYLAYRLEGPPFLLPTALASLLFLAYLAGTVTSRLSGAWAMAYGRRHVLMGGAVVYAAGTLLTLVGHLAAILAGLVLLTGGYFAAQAIAAGWAGARPREGTAQATALYNMGYYAGAALIGWAGGFPYRWFGWPGVVVAVLALIGLAQLLVVTCRDLEG